MKVSDLSVLPKGFYPAVASDGQEFLVRIDRQGYPTWSQGTGWNDMDALASVFWPFRLGPRIEFGACVQEVTR